MNTTTRPQTTEPAEQIGISGVMMFLGIALMIIGIIAVATSAIFTLATVVLLAVFLIAGGMAEIIHAVKLRGSHGVGWAIASGIIYLAAGIMLLAHPIAGALSLTALLAIFYFVAGIIRIARSISLRSTSNWGWLLFSGILNVLISAAIWLGWPVSGLWVIGLFVGIDMLIHGAAMVGLSIEAGRMERRLLS